MALDENGNGGFEANDLVNLLQNVTNVDLTSEYSNTVDLTGIYSVARGVFVYDQNQDGRLDKTEFDDYLTAAGFSASQIAEAENTWLTDGYINLAQWMKILENFDAAKNGIWDATDDVALRASVS